MPKSEPILDCCSISDSFASNYLDLSPIRCVDQPSLVVREVKVSSLLVNRFFQPRPVQFKKPAVALAVPLRSC